MLNSRSKRRKIKYVYVAGPYTGNEGPNTTAAAKMGSKIRSAGMVPFVPHLMSHLWQIITPYSYEEWMEFFFEWIKRCDAVVQMAKSPGSDREVAFARGLGKPTFESFGELLDYNASINELAEKVTCS